MDTIARRKAILTQARLNNHRKLADGTNPCGHTLRPQDSDTLLFNVLFLSLAVNEIKSVSGDQNHRQYYTGIS